ncbi:hotdog fold thioesterase [bacterium]|nr:hotdog fold thioesterase [bacterium]
MKTPCPYMEYLQIEEITRKEGTARLAMPFREEITNPNGFVQGGAIASLADAALAAALSSLTGDALFFTAKMEVRFKSPTKDRTLVCDS